MDTSWKTSSDDLQSRLKTRKVLGVGQTDSGEVHRSKLSQVLSHSEHLHSKFPRGLTICHWILTITTGITGVLAILSPSSVNFLDDVSISDKHGVSAAASSRQPEDAGAAAADVTAATSLTMTYFNMAARLVGISQLCISLFHYLLLDSVDRKLIRGSLFIACLNNASILTMIFGYRFYSGGRIFRSQSLLKNLMLLIHASKLVVGLVYHNLLQFQSFFKSF